MYFVLNGVNSTCPTDCIMVMMYTCLLTYSLMYRTNLCQYVPCYGSLHCFVNRNTLKVATLVLFCTTGVLHFQEMCQMYDATFPSCFKRYGVQKWSFTCAGVCDVCFAKSHMTNHHVTIVTLARMLMVNSMCGLIEFVRTHLFATGMSCIYIPGISFSNPVFGQGSSDCSSDCSSDRPSDRPSVGVPYRGPVR
jgi:hypothetical protein